MTHVFKNDEHTRTLKIGEAFSMDLLNNTFEGALLYALVTDDAPIVRSGDDQEMFLGTDYMCGEGYLTFGGDVIGLSEFIDFCRTSQGRCAKTLLPALENGLKKQAANADDYLHFQMHAVPMPDGTIKSITVAELLQDILIEHGDKCTEDHFTVIGNYALSGDPDRLGGYALFITADEIRFQSNDGWLRELRDEHRQRSKHSM